jgi:hypothetical protein
VVAVPALLLLIARDLLLHDPPRVLAWRFLHDPRLGSLPAPLAALLPRPDAALDRDPVALLLGALASGLAIAYALAALSGAAPRRRAALLAVAAVVLVVAPTLAFAAMGWATQRPYGQDGGVVQLPLALDKILAGQSPYGADYSDSILGKEARVSEFWASYGGNPILHHHAYLPGTHLLMLPFYLLGRAVAGAFDPRVVTLLAYGLAVWLAAGLVSDPNKRLIAAAAVAVNPLVYWHQVFGANDMLIVALLLAAVALAQRERPLLACAVLGLACGTKQLAWPFAPFLLAHVSGAGNLRELVSLRGLRRLMRPALVTLAVGAAVVAPVALLDLRRFWADIVAYNVGLPGADNYPLGGTPGFGFANVLLYCGAVSSLKDYFPFSLFYVLLVPVGLLLLREQLRAGSAAASLATGSAALLASLYFSRVVHPNYLVIVASLLPVGLLAASRWRADVGVVPLLLLATAVEISEHEVLRSTWEQAAAVRLPQHLGGLASLFAPRAGPELTADPLGAGLSALAAGLALLYVLAGLLHVSNRARLVLVLAASLVLVALPVWIVSRVEHASGAPRAQHPWLAGMLREDRQARGLAPVVVREAWSQSFRRDPPGVVEAPPLTAGSRWLARLLAIVRVDPRLVGLVGLGLTGALLVRRLPEAEQPLAWGAALLSPIVALGVAFGSPEGIVLGAALAGWALAQGAWPLAAGLTLGAAAALAPRLWLAAPLLILVWLPERGRPRALVGFVVAAVGLQLAGAALLPGPALAFPELSAPGLGGWNLLLYRGVDAGLVVKALTLLLPLGAVLAAWRQAWLHPPPALFALAWAGVWLLAALWLTPGASPHDLALPLVLLLLPLLLG